jgi:Trypsin-like peptidase domain/AAA-like domain
MGNFIYHGPLPADSNLFRGRQKELNKLLRICLGVEQSYAIIYGGRQMGKTSLLMRLEQDLSLKGVRSCRVDFQGIARAPTSRVFNHLAEKITEGLSIDTGIKEVNDAAQFTAFLRQAVECIAPKRFTLMLEEMGALLPETQYVLANVIRSNFTNRHMVNYRPLDQLTVVLAGSLELRNLAVQDVSPLDNICEQIYLSDLSEKDSIDLIMDGLELADLSWAEVLGQAVYAQVKGFPYLTQRIGAKLDEEINTGRRDAAESVERVIEQILKDDSLLVYLHKILEEQNLWPTLQALLEEPVSYTRIANELVHLELLGLITEASNYWVVRNMLLKRALKMWSGNRLKKAQFEHAIARIYDIRANAPVGAGFLIGDRQVLTCAHVVSAALRLPEKTPEMPADEVSLDFPLAAANKSLTAKVTRWKPDQDIAWLELTSAPPQEVTPVSILPATNLWGHFFRAFGFPMGHPDGVWASGVLRGLTGRDWIQIEDIKGQGICVQPGFSGCLVWDENLDSVVGMVVAADRKMENRVAFAIPATLFP